MSIAAAQATAFFDEVVVTREVWTIRDEGGFPTSTNASGETAMPFWSKESRALALTKKVHAYRGFKPERLSLDQFVKAWLPGLEKDGLFVGVNWAGQRGIGYDMSPKDVLARLEVMGANGT